MFREVPIGLPQPAPNAAVIQACVLRVGREAERAVGALCGRAAGDRVRIRSSVPVAKEAEEMMTGRHAAVRRAGVAMRRVRAGVRGPM